MSSDVLAGGQNHLLDRRKTMMSSVERRNGTHDEAGSDPLDGGAVVGDPLPAVSTSVDVPIADPTPTSATTTAPDTVPVDSVTEPTTAAAQPENPSPTPAPAPAIVPEPTSTPTTIGAPDPSPSPTPVEASASANPETPAALPVESPAPQVASEPITTPAAAVPVTSDTATPANTDVAAPATSDSVPLAIPGAAEPTSTDPPPPAPAATTISGAAPSDNGLPTVSDLASTIASDAALPTSIDAVTSASSIPLFANNPTATDLAVAGSTSSAIPATSNGILVAPIPSASFANVLSSSPTGFQTSLVPTAASQLADTLPTSVGISSPTSFIPGTNTGGSVNTSDATPSGLAPEVSPASGSSKGKIAATVTASVIGSLLLFIATVFLIRRFLYRRRLAKAESPPASPLLESLDASLPSGIARSMSQRTGRSENWPFRSDLGSMLNGVPQPLTSPALVPATSPGFERDTSGGGMGRGEVGGSGGSGVWPGQQERRGSVHRQLLMPELDGTEQRMGRRASVQSAVVMEEKPSLKLETQQQQPQQQSSGGVGKVLYDLFPRTK